jgi:hypothetical protein
MTGRYSMMDSIYEYVYGEKCAPLHSHPKSAIYSIPDDRIVSALIKARKNTPDETVMNPASYKSDVTHPFLIKT